MPDLRPTSSALRGAAAAGRGLRRAAVERVRQELDKLLLATRPDLGLSRLETLGLRHAVLPELDPMIDCVAGADRPDVWTHTVGAVGFGAAARRHRLPGYPHLAEKSERRVLQWSLLLHDLAKPETLATGLDGRPTFHGHEVLGESAADALLERMRQPAALRRRVRKIIRFHLRPGHLADAGAPERGMRRLVRDAGSDLPILAVHAAADARASGSPDGPLRWRRLRAVLVRLMEMWTSSAATPGPALIDGRDVMRALGLSPGPRIGRLLERVRSAQEEGIVRTRKQALAYLRSEAIRSPSR
jgi:poly(A) polymerase